MRHGNTINKLSRTHSHRKALLSNMANSLILHKRMVTTLAKAKSLRRYVEPLLTKSKTDDTHNRRVVFSYLQQKEVLKELFGVVAPKIADRPGGYTRILKLGPRQGDNTEMALIELVDFNEYLVSEPGKGAKSRRTRRGKKKGAETTAPVATAPVPASPVVTAPADEVTVAEVPVAETPVAEVAPAEVAVSETTAAEVTAAEVPVAETTVAEMTSATEETAVAEAAPEAEASAPAEEEAKPEA